MHAWKRTEARRRASLMPSLHPSLFSKPASYRFSKDTNDNPTNDGEWEPDLNKSFDYVFKKTYVHKAFSAYYSNDIGYVKSKG